MSKTFVNRSRSVQTTSSAQRPKTEDAMAQQKPSNVQRNVLPKEETRGSCGYTMIPPKEKNRLKMQSIADKETKGYEAFKQSNRPYFNIVRTLGSGEPQERKHPANMSAKPKKSEQVPKKGDKAPEKEKKKDSLTKLKKDEKGSTPSPGASVLAATAAAPGAESGAKDNECPPPCCEPCCPPCCDPCCDPCCMPCCDENEDDNNQQNANDACGPQQHDAACPNNPANGKPPNQM